MDFLIPHLPLSPFLPFFPFFPYHTSARSAWSLTIHHSSFHMRRPPYHRDERGRLDVKMTPMIDVIFLLLIFFVCTASFQAAEEVLPANLSLPGTLSTTEPIDQELEDLEEIVVNIFWRDGGASWQINQRDLNSLGEVALVLQAAAGVRIDLPVILDADDAVPIGDVIDVWDVCRAIGLERVQFAASPDAGG